MRVAKIVGNRIMVQGSCRHVTQTRTMKRNCKLESVIKN